MEHAGVLESLAGSRRSGGRVTLDTLARVLGLDAAPEPFRLRSAAWIQDHLEARIGAGEDREVTVELRAAEPGAKAYVATANVLVSFRGDFLPPEVAGPVAAHARNRLGAATLADLAAVVRDDPDGAALPDPTAPKRKGPVGLLDSWGSSDGYADFFAAGELARGRLDSIDPTRMFRFVQHCESECAATAPRGPAPLLSVVEYPWEGRHHGRGPGAQFGAEDDGEEAHLSTDLTEQDVIRGNPEKLRSTLEKALARPNPLGKVTLVSNTCVPAVMGEDVESVVRQFARKSRDPLLFLNVSPKSMHDLMRGLLVDRRLAAEAAAGAPEPMSVNLVGFADTLGRHELEQMLAAFGVRVHCEVVPEIDTKRVERMAGASLNVFRPNRLWDNLYDQVREGTRIPAVEPPAPFGREGTFRFVEAVLRALGRQDDVRPAWDALAAPLDDAWARAVERCSRLRLGFVLRGRDIHYLRDPANSWGIPLVAMLEEAGFGIDVLLLLKNANDARAKAREVHALFRDPARHSIRGFHTLAKMRERMAEAPCQAFFTHQTFDWRVSEAGKGRFSLQHFEVGLAGAIRTMDRLAQVCETPFYGRFRRFLRRDDIGLPAGGATP